MKEKFESHMEVTKTWEEKQIIDNLENNWYKSLQEIIEMIKEVIELKHMK